MRNYDYLPADVDALRAEIARLDAEVVAAREEGYAAGVAAERARCARLLDISERVYRRNATECSYPENAQILNKVADAYRDDAAAIRAGADGPHEGS